MISIPCDHPDLEEFIGIKQNTDRVTKANISIRITDRFMAAVKNREPFELKFTRLETGEVITKTVNAYDIFHKICESNWDWAEPGMLFWDRINEYNLLSYDNTFEYAGVNPCFSGEQELLTADGYKKFEDLCDTEPYIINSNGNVVKSKVWCSGEKDTVVVKTPHYEITCTPDHKFMTLDGSECCAKDLKGKYLMPMSLANKKMDNHFVKLGFIQGDGNLTRLDSPHHDGIEVNIGQKDTDILDLFLDETFTVQSERSIYLKNFKDELINLGFSHDTLPYRKFPESYNSWSKTAKASFLQGCYSANGSVIKGLSHHSSGRISYKTTCLEFAEQLAETLKNDFDIQGVYITTNKAKKTKFSNGEYTCRESYDVNIGRFKEITKFIANINFYQLYKREQLLQMMRRKNTKVTSVKAGKKIRVYDFTEPERHWGIVDGFVVHNCAEEPLPAGGSCLLGSINLSEFVRADRTFDFDEFAKTVDIAVKALNKVLDEGLPLHPLKEQRESVRDWRQIGLGIFALADMLIKMGIRYGSEDAIHLCDMIGHKMAYQAIKTSAELARVIGHYPKYHPEAVAQSVFYSEHVGDADTSCGLANSQLLTIAPTGTISTMLGVSGGIEPIFANYYTRKTESLHGHDEYYKVYTPIVRKYMEDNNLNDDSELPSYFVTAQSLNYVERLKMQAIWQKHIDASISSTVNVPNDFTVEQTEDLYMKAWEMGLKGVTIFRDGCKRVGILTTDKEEEKEEVQEEQPSNTSVSYQMNTLPRGVVIKANDNCVGKKRTLITGCGTLHVEAFFDPVTGELLETYFSKGAFGGCNSTLVGLSRMISLAARGGISLYDILDQIKSPPTCSSYAVRTATKKDTSKGNCCPTAIGNALKDMYEEMQRDIEEEYGTDDEEEEDIVYETKETGFKKSNPLIRIQSAKCPQCGGNLVFEGGCNTCKDCGWSKCS